MTNPTSPENNPQQPAGGAAPDYAAKLTEAAEHMEHLMREMQQKAPQAGEAAASEAEVSATIREAPATAHNAATVAAGAANKATMPVRSGTRDALVRVAPHIFRLDLPVPELLPTTNSYLVLGGKHSLIIDTGCNLTQTEDAFEEALSRLNVSWNTVDVFLTHSDFDHCAGLTKIARQGMIVYAGMDDYRERTTPIMASGAFAEIARQVCERHNVPYTFDREYLAPMADRGTDDIRVSEVEEGDTLKVGDFRFQCIATPGHNPHHICLYEPNARILVAGDHLLGSQYPSLSLTDVNVDEYAEYLDSLDKVRDLPCDLVLCGHGEEFTDLPGRVDAIKAHFARQLDYARQAIADGITDPGEIAYATTHLPRRTPWEERSVFQFNALVGQTMVLLRHLVETGEYPHPELLVHR